MTQFSNCLDARADLSPKTLIFCLLNKMNLLAENIQFETFMEKKMKIEKKVKEKFELECFRTSIWDETLYRACSQIVSFLLLNSQ